MNERLTYQIKFANNESLWLLLTGKTSASYTVTDIQLEFEKVRSEALAMDIHVLLHQR